MGVTRQSPAPVMGSLPVLRPGYQESAVESPSFPTELMSRRLSGPPRCQRSSVGINNGNFVLLYVARLEPQKDHASLLRALSQIPDADLVLAGDGSLRAELEAQAEMLGLARRVHFLGRRKDVAALLKMADIYVHPAAYEGFGIAAAEAMAAGKPVVASNVPGLAQVVGDAGILVPPADPATLATEVCNLISSPDRRQQLSRAAVERGRTFSIENTVAAYLDLYRSVLSR